jgi:hypothetical protein
MAAVSQPLTAGRYNPNQSDKAMGDTPKDAAAVTADLERIRAQVRERALHQAPQVRLAAPLPVRAPVVPQPDPEPVAAALPVRPDPAAVNSLWRAEAAGDKPGLLRRFVNRMVAPARAAQVAWNARQVQFDNELLAYVDGRLHATHLQYDSVLGIHAQHLQEIDERHLILQEELVAHVHDLVKRIDLVLSLSERETLGIEASLRELRARLSDLEPARKP